MSDEDRAREIVQRARAERTRPSRTLWLVALVLGGACAIAFGVMMFADGSASPAPSRAIEDRGLGFGAGVLVGAVLGIAVGFAIARQRHSSRSRP